MKGLSTLSRLFIIGALFPGGALLVYEMTQLRVENIWLLILACVLASIAQVLKVEGVTSRTSYNPSWVVYAFAFFLMGAPAAMLVIVVSHLVEWLRYRYPWYVQLFNISAYVIATFMASLTAMWIKPLPLPFGLATALSILAATATFTLIDHLMVGMVVWLAHAENPVKSGVFRLTTLMFDLALFSLGVAAAIIWQFNPFAVIMTVFPLYVIFEALRIPALQRLADIDEKTGLMNARSFIRALRKALARSRQSGGPLTVVFGDIDLLRNINNSYGHLTGDAVLIKTAQILQQSARADDVVSRFGGEEFAVLMPGITPVEALPYVERLRIAIRATIVVSSSNVAPMHVTMSFGIAGQEPPGLSTRQIMENADKALYRSKALGRDRVTVYSRTGQAASSGGGVVNASDNAPHPHVF